jgi:hypothetical protein
MPDLIRDARRNPLKGPQGMILELRVRTPNIQNESEHPLKDAYNNACNALKKAKDYALCYSKRLLDYFPKII